MVSCPTLRSACRNARSSPDRSGRWPFNASLPPSRKSSRQAASRWASTPSSRDSTSNDSPRNSRSTASISLPADHPGPRPVVAGLLVLVLVVHRHDRHHHPCLSGVQENRERWTRTSRQQYLASPHVAQEDLQPGDLLFWAYNTSDPATIHHVAIYLGRDTAGVDWMIDAPHTGATIQVRRVYWTGYIGASRP
jgi:NlpC/P60 family